MSLGLGSPETIGDVQGFGWDASTPSYLPTAMIAAGTSGGHRPDFAQNVAAVWIPLRSPRSHFIGRSYAMFARWSRSLRDLFHSSSRRPSKRNMGHRRPAALRVERLEA